MTNSDIEAIEFEQTNGAMGVYIESVGVYADGSREVLDATTVGSPREFERIRAFENRCKRQYGK
ncbi:hypothetical protein [Halapricum hydrolyticum]|uniref:Uncharacterized protein n=1 Tax=Halapricum hydrolyticum TaxID=2979991 RepID=A0AAE3ICU0_9EURY|nr:hypothetical protein [Halapricum hydrolyticum]MCU4718719.1 hypothetical protein [Halapricum hydrolyticum]MCU4727706.1 hypothetical protein [Halapricum hydrolyticum]